MQLVLQYRTFEITVTGRFSKYDICFNIYVYDNFDACLDKPKSTLLLHNVCLS